jgi:hypothetical protein
MNAITSPASFLAPNSTALAPRRGETEAPDGNKFGNLPALFGGLGKTLVKGELGEATNAAIAQISDMGRSFLERFQESGASAGSFDLHLDLEALGLKIDGAGARSAEAHKLSVDMHVEATRGVIQTEHGEVHFERIEMSFTIQETHVRMQESKPGAGKELLDGLKGLASLLDKATEGQEGQDFGLDRLRNLLAEHTGELEKLLDQIGRGFERMNSGEMEFQSEETQVQLEMLRFVKAALPTPPALPEPTAEVAEPAA